MKPPVAPSRRVVLVAGASLLAGGCEPIDGNPAVQGLLEGVNDLNYRVQRFLVGPDKLAPEYTEKDITQAFRPNGSTDPRDPAYRALAATGFAGFALQVDGLVERPQRFTLAALRALPARTQITRHDCVEGWSVIGKWKGVPLAALLDAVGVRPQARYVICHCADAPDADAQASDDFDPDSARFYGSVDLAGARHPQTILAYELNDKVLDVAHGAPLRLRLERQLGYKMSKYVMRLELVDSFAALGKGKGGYWEDLGYDWFAGI
jgi:DMSO/TMAO reductase YedYZ molybdopterin-dependent catalytic subunit